MIQASLLKTLYSQSSFNRNAPLRAVVESLFDKNCLEERLIASALPAINSNKISNPENLLEKWRELLTLLLILRAKNSLETLLPQLIRSLRDLERHSFWPEHQLCAIYHATASFILNQPVKEFSYLQLENGACPLEAEGFSLKGEVPHVLYHAELGTLFCLYGDLSGRSEFVERAFKLAEWQRHSLDYNSESFVGLFSCEGEASERLLLINNFLLFNAIAKVKKSPEMAFLAEKQLENLFRLVNRESIDIPSYSIAFEEYFFYKDSPQISDCSLPQAINDELLVFVGARSQECSAVATLYGGKSSMGSYHYKDIKVVSYGPQHVPLGDCTGFGLEGNQRIMQDQVTVQSTFSGGFVLEGVFRMPANPHLKNTDFPHAGWMQSRQELRENHLSIKTQLQSLFDQEGLVFSFFVKCKSCVIDGEKVIRPRSLNRYLGKSASITLQTDDSSIVLKGMQKHEEMHVIPLGGGDNFWGADFLIAYSLKEGTESCSWQIHP